MFGMSRDEDAEGRKDSSSGCVWVHACFFFVAIDIDSSVDGGEQQRDDALAV